MDTQWCVKVSSACRGECVATGGLCRPAHLNSTEIKVNSFSWDVVRGGGGGGVFFGVSERGGVIWVHGELVGTCLLLKSDRSFPKCIILIVYHSSYNRSSDILIWSPEAFSESQAPLSLILIHILVPAELVYFSALDRYWCSVLHLCGFECSTDCLSEDMTWYESVIL